MEPEIWIKPDSRIGWLVVCRTAKKLEAKAIGAHLGICPVITKMNPSKLTGFTRVNTLPEWLTKPK